MKPNLCLRLARTNTGLTQEELAEMVGTSVVSVYRWEHGDNVPSQYFRQRLCTVLQSSERELGWSMVESREEEGKDLPPRLTPFLIDPCLPAGRANFVGQQPLLNALARSNERILGLTGLPGCGKTAVAQALAIQPAIHERFEGVLWAALGTDQHPLRHFHRWAMLLQGPGQVFPSHMDEAQDLLRVLMRERRLLIVLDDVWAASDVAPYHLGGQGCQYVMTTRQPALAHTLCEVVYRPSPLTNGQGFHLLTRELPPLLVREHRQVLRALSQHVGNLPAALVQMGRFLRGEACSLSQRRFQEALTQLFQPTSYLALQLPPGTCSLQQRIAQSEQRLPASARQALSLVAAHFPAAPATVAERQIVELFHAHPPLKLTDLDTLVDAGLLSTAGRNRYQLHPVIAASARQATISQMEPGMRHRQETEKRPPDHGPQTW